MLIVEICLFVYLTLGVLNCVCWSFADKRCRAIVLELLRNRTEYAHLDVPSVAELERGVGIASVLDSRPNSATLLRVLFWPRYFDAFILAAQILWPFGTEVPRTQK